MAHPNGPRHRDFRQQEPPLARHGHSRAKHRRDYPPHWKVRQDPDGYSLELQGLRLPNGKDARAVWYEYFDPVSHEVGSKAPKRKDLQGLLDWFAERYPNTAAIAVRFIGCVPCPCKRTVLQDREG